MQLGTENLKKILFVLTKKQRKNIYALLVLAVIAVCFEVLGISLFIPIISILIDGNNQSDFPLIKSLIKREKRSESIFSKLYLIDSRGEDIKLLKTDEKMGKKRKKVEKEKKHQDNEINYACLEENCDKIKKINNETQTKCYLKHKNEKGEIILQYFQDNYKTKKRLDKLESDGNEIITHSMLKKGEKVLKKSKIVNNIKINTIFD